MTRFITTAVLVFGAAYLLLSAGDATALSPSSRLPMAAWLLLPGLIVAVAVWRLDDLTGPQVVLLLSAVLLVAANTSLWRWLALGPPDSDVGYVLPLVPVVEIFLLLPALMAAWLAQSLHLLRQLRDLRPEAEALKRLDAELAELRSDLIRVEEVLAQRQSDLH